MQNNISLTVFLIYRTLDFVHLFAFQIIISDESILQFSLFTELLTAYETTRMSQNKYETKRFVIS